MTSSLVGSEMCIRDSPSNETQSGASASRPSPLSNGSVRPVDRQSTSLRLSNFRRFPISSH
eukprot:5128869-Prorocentrum_lima.AAC.1